MGLLNVFLKACLDEEQAAACDDTPLNRFVDNVGNRQSTTSTNVQSFGTKAKNEAQKPKKGELEHRTADFPTARKPSESTNLGSGAGNVDVVACVRGNESSKLTPFSQVNARSEPTPVSSLARASDFVDKLRGCDSCPACGYWDGYGPVRMAPVQYCFYSAVFKGKPARPVLSIEAEKTCPRRIKLEEKGS
jgi:hypothetical protein